MSSQFWCEYLEAAQHTANVEMVCSEGRRTQTHTILLAAGSHFLRLLLAELPNTEERTVIILPDFSVQEVDMWIKNILTQDMKDGKSQLRRTLCLPEEEDWNIEEESHKIEIEEMKDEEPIELQSLIKEEQDEGEEERGDEIDISDPEIICDDCGKKFESDEHLQGHISLAHKSKYDFVDFIEDLGDSWKCTICKKIYDKRSKCVNHLKSGHKLGAKLNCKACNKLFYHKWALKDHLKIHSKTKDFICDLCGKAFMEKSQLKRHNIKMHSSEVERIASRKYVCSTCAKSFYCKTALTDHEFIHKEGNNFFCDQCEQAYKTKNALRLHKNRKHLGKYLRTEEQRTKENARRMEWRAERKARNGGSLRTPEEKIKFNEYMREYQAKKRQQNIKQGIL